MSRFLETVQNTLSRINQSEGPIKRFYNAHYQKIEVTAAQLSDNDLVKRIVRYKKAEPLNTFLITGLGVTDAYLLAELASHSPNLHPLVLPLLAGPVALGIGLIGPHRGMVRDEEKKIYQQELSERTPNTSNTSEV